MTMAVTQADLDRFHEFASERIRDECDDVSFDDLVVEWESIRDRHEIDAAIQEGLSDVEGGHHRPAGEAMADLQRKHGLPST